MMLLLHSIAMYTMTQTCNTLGTG